ncbi:hypothetical protein ACIBTV_25625 [Micromonospora sp. NPDC049366]|uniref:hypothetical protein n=1 Tax=Micromonospora sp. NPDC049366 TaxID=3364271 RepID=UPI0037B09846
MSERMRVYRFDSAFLPYAVTAAIGLPHSVTHADLLIVAHTKTDAGALAARLRINPGSRHQFLRLARHREAHALSRARLRGEPAVFALASIDHAHDGYLVRVEQDNTGTRVCPVRELRMRDRDDVELVS